MNSQKLGAYLTYAGYLFGVVAIVLSAHNIPILVAAAGAVLFVFVGRQLEKVKP